MATENAAKDAQPMHMACGPAAGTKYTKRARGEGHNVIDITVGLSVQGFPTHRPGATEYSMLLCGCETAALVSAMQLPTVGPCTIHHGALQFLEP